VWKHSDTSGLWQAEMECSGQIVEFSARSAERERERERGREREKHVIVYYVHAKCGKFFMF